MKPLFESRASAHARGKMTSIIFCWITKHYVIVQNFKASQRNLQHQIETNKLICCVNQLTGSYVTTKMSFFINKNGKIRNEQKLFIQICLMQCIFPPTKWEKSIYWFLTLWAPTPQNGQTHSNNSSAFECLWPFMGVGA